MQFYTVSDNSLGAHSFPWVESMRGVHYVRPCAECRREDLLLANVLTAELMANKGSKWPDALGCGSPPGLLILSDKVTRAWQQQGFGELPLKSVILDGELPRKLRHVPAPRYFCVDRSRLLGAELDADASGYAGIRRCNVCCRLYFDDVATALKQSDTHYPFVISEAKSRGSHLFTVELALGHFFCTQRFVDLAQTFALSNFRFVPAERRDAAGERGIRYLKTASP